MDKHRNISRRYAYVTLVMLGDKYVPAALVLAYSLRSAYERERRRKCRFPLISEFPPDLIVMVDKSVSQSARTHLSVLYDRVEETLFKPKLFKKGSKESQKPANFTTPTFTTGWTNHSRK
eukprot:388270_1